MVQRLFTDSQIDAGVRAAQLLRLQKAAFRLVPIRNAAAGQEPEALK